MVIYRLFDDPIFPDPSEAEADGLLAVGGDLTPLRLLNAYAAGIFPWYGPGSPILWWSTDPRPVLFPGELHVARSLRRRINSGCFTCTLDRDFARVIRACSRQPRPGQTGTWLVPEMIEAYEHLHRLGFAHSVEARLGGADGELVGGLYGVALGRAFFGESMFHAEPDASKAAFVFLVEGLKRRGYHFIDCQQTTPHVLRFGAREIPRSDFLRRLNTALQLPTEQHRWTRWEQAEAAQPPA